MAERKRRNSKLLSAYYVGGSLTGMNDTDLREQALVDYEYKKSIISQKESRIDTRMQDLQTEQSAINQMLQGLETVKKENIDRTMNIFG